MPGRKLQIVFASFVTCLALPASPSACHAQCCNWFRRAAPPVAATTYRPLFAVAAPPVAAQTVNYMPYTAYRTVYTNMPVTTYQPTTICNPCGGGTTVMRPVTTYAMQPQLVPFTSYRPVVTAVTAAYAPMAPVCSPCGGMAAPLVPSQLATSSPYPVATYAPAPAAPCASCAGAPAAPMMQGMPGSSVPSLTPTPNINAPPSLNYAPAQPLSPVPQGGATYSTPGGATFANPPAAAYSAPAGATYLTPASPPGSTFSNPPATTNGSNGSSTNGSSSGSSGATAPGITVPESRLRPKLIPNTDPSGTAPSNSPPSGFSPNINNDDSTPNSNDGIDGRKTNLQQPRLLNPQDRMTARPMQQSTVYKPVSANPVTQAVAIQQAPLDDSGWRPGRRAE